MIRSSFTIEGDPIGKPTMTQAVKWSPTERQERYFAWCDAARQAADPEGPVDENGKHLKIDNVAHGIFGIYAVAHIGMPISWSKKKKAALAGKVCDQKPDKDNIEKSLNDALFTDDKRICIGGVIGKLWCHEDERPRVDVFLLMSPQIAAIDPNEEVDCATEEEVNEVLSV